MSDHKSDISFLHQMRVCIEHQAGNIAWFPFMDINFLPFCSLIFFKEWKDALECGFHSIVIRQTWQKPEHMYLKNQKPYIIFQSLLQQIMSKNWYLLLQAGNKKVQWITKKHIPLVFQPFVYLVYLRNHLSYKISTCVFLHPFLKHFQMEQEFFTSGDKISWYMQKR